MIGCAHVAGCAGRIREDADAIAQYFSVPLDRLTRGLESLESGIQPGVLLLQNPRMEANVGAAVFYSSVWSKAYERVGTPYGKVHRDFHYQCLFVAMATLVEVGCDQIRVENPMKGHPWKRDAYVCLLEAVRNVEVQLNPAVTVCLQEGSYELGMVRRVDANLATFELQQHRPVGICPSIFEGFNLRTVFIEKADVSLSTSYGGQREYTSSTT